jgi:uncharacterized membrane protein YsdA (DUF1294 family)
MRKRHTTEGGVGTVNDMDQQTELDRLFKAARQAHESGNWNEALRLYKAVSDQNPYYPGLDIQMRALEMRMTRGSVSEPQAQRSAPGCNPYLMYGIIALAPAAILTWILKSNSPPGWDLLFWWLVVINAVTFLLYGYDKMIAPTGIMRVPDSVLLALVFLGAFVGAPLACELFRHKTQKLPFRHNFWVAEIISVVWVALYYILPWAISGAAPSL